MRNRINVSIYTKLGETQNCIGNLTMWMWVYLNILGSNYNTPLSCLITVGSVAELSNRSCEPGSDISGSWKSKSL